jgi:hypothetical protein
MKRKYKLAPLTAFACTAILSMVSSQAISETSGDWKYSIAPFYLWAKNIEGSTSIGGNAGPIDLDFKDDILENLDGAFAFHFEARKEKLTLFAEYNYAKLDPSTTLNSGPIEVKASIDFEDIMWELGTMYELADSGSTQWEILGGYRYIEQDIKLSLSGGAGLGLLARKTNAGDDWWHLFGGLRVTTKLSERWRLRARADYGYRDNKNRATHASAFADYRFRDWGSFFAGYRYLDTDYDNDEPGSKQYGSDISQQGPVLGVNFYF